MIQWKRIQDELPLHGQIVVVRDVYEDEPPEYGVCTFLRDGRDWSLTLFGCRRINWCTSKEFREFYKLDWSHQLDWALIAESGAVGTDVREGE